MRRFVAWLVVLMAVAVVAGCASAPDRIIGAENPSIPALSVAGAKTHSILVATTRERATDPAVFLTGERAEGLDFAYTEVSVPPSHQPGKIERSSGPIPDPRQHFVVSEGRYVDGPASFQSMVDRSLAALPEDDRSVLIFVHGYNTDFTDALLRLTQFVHDTQFTGVPVLFSWASRGQVAGYLYDLNSTYVARDGLEQLAGLLDETQAQHFDVVSHSMGNYLVLETMRQLELQGRLANSDRIGSIILASPDVDIDVFQAQWQRITADREKFFILISQDDRALRLSRRLAGGVSRVGNADPDELAAMGFNVIDLSRVEDQSSTHHSKFASAPQIVQLIGTRLALGDELGRPDSQQAQVTAASLIPNFDIRGVRDGTVVTIDDN
ncbi:MAG: alpha/beta hydrolase [Pseudomonadota bacterium]